MGRDHLQTTGGCSVVMDTNRELVKGNTEKVGVTRVLQKFLN
jgi:hypothetical protein